MASVYKRGGTGNYWMSWRDAEGRRRAKSSGTRDKRTAKRIADELEAQALLRREGVIDAKADRYTAEAQRAVSEHLDDYESACGDAGHSARGIRGKMDDLHAMVQAIEAKTVGDLLGAPDRLAHAVANTPCRHRDGVDSQGHQRWRQAAPSARTKNRRRAALIAFANWLRKSGRIEGHTMNNLPRADELRDRRRVRRPLTDEEAARLIAVARERDAELNSEPSYPHVTSCRAVWHTAALLGGLRKGDLQRLRRGDIDFEATTITVSDGKAKRVDVLPLHPDLASELRAIKSDIVSLKAKVFRTAVTDRTRRSDFDRAGIPREDEEGRVADLHALRTKLGTRLARAGVAPQVAQKVMRHSNYQTTLQHCAGAERYPGGGGIAARR